jgi:meiotically up-regulated gene 157 (Mug157) protein
MFAHYLAFCPLIMQTLNPALAAEVSTLASSLRTAAETYGVVTDLIHGQIYAYKIDGYGLRNITDDVNIPFLLSAPVFGHLNVSSPVYQNTRSIILSNGNPYFIRGPVINNVRGPYNGPGYGRPMASIVRILTGDNNTDIAEVLKEIVSSSDRLGLIHEDIDKYVCLVKTLGNVIDAITRILGHYAKSRPCLAPLFSQFIMGA